MNVVLDGLCCSRCGYDLRGQEEFRCPECGLRFDPAPPPDETKALPGPGGLLSCAVGGALLMAMPFALSLLLDHGEVVVLVLLSLPLCIISWFGSWVVLTASVLNWKQQKSVIVLTAMLLSGFCVLLPGIIAVPEALRFLLYR